MEGLVGPVRGKSVGTQERTIPDVRGSGRTGTEGGYKIKGGSPIGGSTRNGGVPPYSPGEGLCIAIAIGADMRQPRSKTPKADCWEVVLHFRDRGLAQGTVDATPLDENGVWLVTMKKGAD